METQLTYNLEELIDLVKNDKYNNWKELTNIQDISSKKIVIEQLQSKLDILNLISQNNT